MANFLGDSTFPAIKQLEVNAEGSVPLDDYRSGYVTGNAYFGQTHLTAYALDSLSMAYALENGKLKAEAVAGSGQQSLQARLNIQRLWAEESVPEMQVAADGRNIDPGYWVQDENFTGDLSFSAELNGRGFQPGKVPWKYNISIKDGRVGNQNFGSLNVQGEATGDKITNLANVQLQKSALTLQASIFNYMDDVPKYEYRLSSDHFDLSECSGLEAFRTELGFVLKGSGSGSTLEDLRLNSTFRMDSSVVNGERINRFLAEITVEDTVATINPVELESTIAEGSFDAQFHLQRWYDVENELNLNLNLIDLQSLAPLADVETLSAEGRITGRLAPIYDNRLRFSGNLGLREISYDEQFTADAIDGDVEIFVVEEPEYVLALNLQSPAFAAVQLRDLLLETRGKMSGEEVNGDFKLNFKGPNESEIVQSGMYRYGSDSTIVTTEQFELITYLRTLLLERPFRLTYKNQALQMEPMRLSSGDGALLEIAAPYVDSLRQEGYLIGENLDLSAIQSAVLSESYFDGVLSGNLSVANTESTFMTQGELEFADLHYQGTSLELLNLELDINNKELFGSLQAMDQGKELMSGKLNLPFRLGDPEEFDESFFERTVDGYFELKPVALNRFDTLLSNMGIVETDGILQVSTELKGKAGKPQITSSMRLDSALVSGVKIDSLTTELHYVHEQSIITLNTTVNSLKQRAAEINALVPFYMDLKTVFL
ncbi:MAG: hypothetical protein GVY02_00780 [Bacteroidetes bacterium]|nr:hypothetical protein [Bacteroidota bacterium]